MLKNNNCSNSNKIPYISYLIKALSMIIVLISVTFSWFVFTKDTRLDGNITGQATTAIFVSISDEEEGTWNNKLEINVESGLVPTTEYSGNGKKLYMPIVEKKQIKGYYLPSKFLNSDDEESDESEVPETSYIDMVSYIKTDGPIALYLSPKSSVTPSDETKSENYIAGAVRVAILVDDYDPYIWAPNSTYEYIGNRQINVEGNPETQYTYAYKDGNEQFLTINDIVTIDNSDQASYGYNKEHRFLWGKLNEFNDYIHDVDPIFKTSTTVNEEVIVKMIVRIWIEGTDREAVQEFIGGKFKINLFFLAIDNK